MIDTRSPSPRPEASRDDPPRDPAHGPWPWLALVLLSLILMLLLELLRVPAALLLGPMLAAVLLRVGRTGIELPNSAFLAAQGVVGCMIAQGIPTTVFSSIGQRWPVFLAGVLGVAITANALGWVLARRQVLPGTTAIWGASPGAATVMVVMSQGFGGDMRLVAFMQYLRIVVVAIAASLVARTMNGAPPADADSALTTLMAGLTAPITPGPALVTLALALSGAWLGRVSRLPAGSLLVPMIVGVVLQDFAGMAIVLPLPLLAVSYAAIGWSIGLRFTRPLLRAAARALPQVLGSILALVAICGGFALLLVRFADVDPLTAYLATSPGGADSIAIIAAGSTGVDLPFVIAMQTLRFLFVLATGPALARMISKRLVMPGQGLR